MIIIPREDPAVQDLNSYYLKIDKLLEHYQGVLGTGGVYFKSPTSEAVVFFDEENLLNSFYKDKRQEFKGRAALDKIVETSSVNNFSVSIYYILPERVYFWANLSNAEELYTDLSSEFTDIEGLIKKIENEKLTGYIDVKLNQEKGGGFLFFYNGEVIGGASAKGGGELDRSAAYRDDLIERSREFGGRFNVKSINLLKITPIAKKVIKPTPKSAATRPVSEPAVKAKAPVRPQKDIKLILGMLEGLLSLLETVIKANKRIKVDFETLLNKKFVDKVDQYDFLDPFAAEFRYVNGEVIFTGKASQKELVKAIVECAKEIAASMGVTNSFSKYLSPWKKRYTDQIMDFNIVI